MNDVGDLIVNSALAGAVIGAFIGLIPLFLGIRKDRFIVGGTGFGLSAAVGTLFGAVPALVPALVFAAIIWIFGKK